jgi:hypothetical protein
MSTSETARGWIFRDCSEQVQTEALVERLSRLVERSALPDKALDALLAAGELECALSDVEDPACAVAANLTDRLALNFLQPDLQNSARCGASLHRIRETIRVSSAKISVPEGFAYYALHPAQFADAVPQLPPTGTTAIVGIRSIGTVLSAVSAASLSRRGWGVSRITTRPHGHPYDRFTQFSSEQLRWIRLHRALEAEFLVVDEGPGLSGSSFLSVAEALESEGVPAHRITLVGTREPDPCTLYARDAAERWQRFRFRCTSSDFYSRKPGEAWGSGRWREQLFGSETHWPSSWPQMERLKFLVRGGSHVLKFDGFGRFGREVRERAALVFESGFGPIATDAGDGLTQYEFVRGRPLTRSDMSADVLERIASYCAFRAGAFRASSSGTNSLLKMALFNCHEELGVEPDLREESFDANSPVIVDGRMQPYEWVRAADGNILKVDACSHGDDHFFPGPTDIAWDLAGVIVEWDLEKERASALLARYQELTGDNSAQRIRDFMIAYASFRLAFCKMASLAVSDPREQARLRNSQQLYRARLQDELHAAVAVTAPTR